MYKKEEFLIENIPVVVYGDSTDKALIYVHGQGGHAEEVEKIADVAICKGYQIFAMDLPEHGKRRDDAKFVPWIVIPELKTVGDYAKKRWKHIVVCSTSIGAWFSLFAFNDITLDRYLFISPLVDMNNMIDSLMLMSGVTETQLEKEKVIETGSGQTLSIEYLKWVRSNPIIFVRNKTSILRAENDEIIPYSTVKEFAEKYDCKVDLMKNGEHWFHTQDQIEHLNAWLNRELK